MSGKFRCVLCKVVGMSGFGCLEPECPGVTEPVEDARPSPTALAAAESRVIELSLAEREAYLAFQKATADHEQIDPYEYVKIHTAWTELYDQQRAAVDALLALRRRQRQPAAPAATETKR